METSKKERFGNRSKFNSPESLQASLNKALGRVPVATDENLPLDIEETDQTIQIDQSLQAALEAEPLSPMSELVVAEDNITPITAIPNLRSTVTTASCVKALEDSAGFGRTSFYLEIGVSLAVFASSTTGTDLATKRVVMDIYSQAGFDVGTDGTDYKTVRRRISTSAKLFNKLGADVVNAAMGGLRDMKAIKSLCHHMGETYKFDTINAVLEFVGEPVQQTNTPEVRAARAAALVKTLEQNSAVDSSIDERIAAQRAERLRKEQEESDGFIVFFGSMSLVIPRDAKVVEIRAMAQKLTEFADRLESEIGTPEEQRNREMHS